MFNKLLNNQSLMVSLDADMDIFDKISNLVQVGINLIEIDQQDYLKLPEIMTAFPNAKIGVGSIVTLEQLENAYQNGAHFTTSPGFLPALAQTANIYSIPYLPGVNTMSDAMQVTALGYDYARVDADLSFCSKLNRHIPNLNLIPFEMQKSDIEHFLHLPCVKVVCLNANALKSSVGVEIIL